MWTINAEQVRTSVIINGIAHDVIKEFPSLQEATINLADTNHFILDSKEAPLSHYAAALAQQLATDLGTSNARLSITNVQGTITVAIERSLVPA